MILDETSTRYPSDIFVSDAYLVDIDPEPLLSGLVTHDIRGCILIEH